MREKREKRERKERTREKKEKKVSRVNHYQSAFNSQKEKLNVLAEMLEIPKSGLILYRPLTLQELLSELINQVILNFSMLLVQTLGNYD